MHNPVIQRLKAATRLGAVAIAAAGVTSAFGQTVIGPELMAPLDAYNSAQQGFVVRTYETVTERGPGDSSSIANVEKQLAGGFGANVATEGPHLVPWVSFTLEDGVAPNDPDWQFVNEGSVKFPGIAGTENFSQELITYLELPAGATLLGVGSDDSFRLTIGVGDNPFNFFAPQPVNGAFSGSRGYNTNMITLNVTEAGVYPMRIVYGQGGGGAGLQVFSFINWGTAEEPFLAATLVNTDAPTFLPGELKSYRPASLPITPSRAYVRSLSPFPGQQDAFPKPLVSAEIKDAGTTVVAGSVTMEFDGSEVTPDVNQAGGLTTVSYQVPDLLGPLTEHTARLSFTDSGANETSQEWTFRTIDLLVLPASYAYPVGSGGTPGFQGNVRVSRKDVGGWNASIATTDARLKDQIIDTTLTPSAPYVNLVQTTSNPGPAPANTVNDDGTYTKSGPINYSMVEAGNAVVDNGFFNSGNDFADSIYPGLPGADDATRTAWTNGRSTAWEEYAWLELPAGLMVFSIWHKDAGQVAIHGNDPRDIFRESMVLFDTNAGNREDSRLVLVEEAGIYGFRIAQAVFSGDQSIEFYTSDPEDQSVRKLIGDTTDPESIKAYATLSVASRPYIDATRPAPVSSGAPVDTTIEVDVVNLGGEAPVMKVNGTTVTYATTVNGDVTTLTHTPTSAFKKAAEVKVELTYGNTTSTWSFFTTSGLKALIVGNEHPAIGAQLARVHKLDVTQLNESAVPADADFLSQFALIWNSEAVNSGNAGPYIRVARELPIPAINVESANAGTGTKHWYLLPGGNNYGASENLVNITNATSVLAGGLRNGTNTILLPGANGTWHGSGPFPTILSGEVFAVGASVEGGANPSIYLEAGTVMDFGGPNGEANWVQPARRIQFAMAGPGMIDKWNDNAWALFDAAVEWLLPERALPAELALEVATNGTITLGWTEDGELQESVDLSTWTPAASQDNPQTVTPGGGQKFYRVVQP